MAIRKCHKFGYKNINSPKVLMKLNRYFRENETFPHPNIAIGLDRKYNSIFLETFPEFQISLRKWACINLARMSCESVQNHINENLIPEIYETYLSEN